MAAGDSWSDLEVELAVADYFHMLMLELSGQKYNKTEHRRRLLPKLTDRSEGSIEHKHQNISAILIEMGWPWIVGYKPRGNYQAALYRCVAARLDKDKKVNQIIEAAVEQPAVAPLAPTYEGLLVSAPRLDKAVAADDESKVRDRRGTHRDYLAVEAHNRSLGLAGEEFVLSYERYHLEKLGEAKLSKRVEHISSTKGDGLGFDILSFDRDGQEKYIEVKTTAFGKEAPFHVTRNELTFSKDEPKRFNLYRLFEFRNKPKMFGLTGPINESCLLDPVNYVARFR